MSSPYLVTSVTQRAPGSTFSIYYPLETLPGDVLLLFINPASTDPIGPSSAGWAEEPALRVGGFGVWWKVVGAAEEGGVTTVDFTGYIDATKLTLAVYRDARNTGGSPIAAPVIRNQAAQTSVTYSTVSAPDVVSPSGDALLIFAAPMDVYLEGDAVSFSGGLTARIFATQNLTSTAAASYVSHVIADQPITSAGSTGVRTFTTNRLQRDLDAAAFVLLPQNSPPNAPIPTSPADGADVNRAVAIQLAATFSDPDPADTPSASKWRYRLTSASAWTEVTQNNTLQSYSIPAGLAAGDYEWQAAYADQKGTWGTFSSSSFFTAADPPEGPVWLDPIDGQTITSASHTGVISVPSLTASEWTLYADSAGVIDTGTIVAGPVTRTTGNLREHEFSGLANDTPVWWSVRIEDGGLWTAPVRVRTPVSFTPPAEATVTVAESSTDGLVSVSWDNPTPGAGEPAAAYVDVDVRDLSGRDTYRPATGIRLAHGKSPDSVLIDHLAASGINYEYRVVTVADNGTTSESPWTPINPTAQPTIYYGGGYDT